MRKRNLLIFTLVVVLVTAMSAPVFAGSQGDRPEHKRTHTDKVYAAKKGSISVDTRLRGRLFLFFRTGVRARKPNSLALRAGEREPCRRRGRLFLFFRPGVRARKPNSLTLQAGERELYRLRGRLFLFFRTGVRARKPNSLALRAGEREPYRLRGGFALRKGRSRRT